MTITQLEYVLAVDKFRHFKKASESCFVSQPSLSMQIQKLEDELGVIIFDRSKSPVMVTIEGERVIKQARIAINEFKKIKEVLNESQNYLSGEFRIGVIPTLSPYITPIFLKPFIDNHPECKLIIEEVKTEDILDRLDKDLLDVGILVTPLGQEKYIERVLYYEKFKIFTSKEHSLFKKKDIYEKDLELDNLWLLNEGHCFRDQVLNICKFKKSKLSKNFLFESGSLETIKNLILKGGGYTLLPEMACEDLSKELKKMVKDFSGKAPVREVSLVSSRLFLKESYINALEEQIISNIPQYLTSNKGKIIPIY